MPKELISVIIPVYNVEQYLLECVESVLSQTYSPIELILVDDGSLDNSGAICDEYSRKNINVRTFHKQNGGLSSARNYGIERANGEYLVFVDSDDYVIPEMLEELHRDLKQNQAVVACCNCFRIYSDGIQNVAAPKYDEFTVLRGDAVLFNLYDNFSACNKLYKRSLFNAIRFPEGKLYEDARTTYRIMELADVATYNPKPMYYYRQRSASIMTSFKPENFLDRVNVWNELISALKSKFTSEQVKTMKVRKNKLVVELIMSFLSSKRVRRNKELLGKLCKEIEIDVYGQSDLSWKERMAVFGARVVTNL